MNTEEVGKKVIDTALAGIHRPFELITHISTLFIAFKLLNAEKLLIRGLKKSGNMSLHQYLSYLDRGVDDVELLTNYKIFDQCSEFYTEEYNIILRSVKEYIFYLAGGRFIYSLLGGIRDESEHFNFITGEIVEVSNND